MLISQLFTQDIPKFLAIYSVVAGSFLGATILMLRGNKDGFTRAG